MQTRSHIHQTINTPHATCRMPCFHHKEIQKAENSAKDGELTMNYHDLPCMCVYHMIYNTCFVNSQGIGRPPKVWMVVRKRCVDGRKKHYLCYWMDAG